jgi:5-deoxy-glucuronate isomerase
MLDRLELHTECAEEGAGCAGDRDVVCVPQTGHVRLEDRVQRVESAEAREDVEISVTDQGPGLPPGSQEAAFEKFSRLSSTQRGGGLGLGLYMPRGIARAHGGDLTVADLVAHGELAYRDVRYFYGPAGLYSIAGFFRVFGTAFTTALSQSHGVDPWAAAMKAASWVMSDGGRFALPSARCESRLPVRHAKAKDVSVELRGAGRCSRQVNNVAAAPTFECARLIVVEVLTPAGNWSSYPPHRHDEDRPGYESVLEEIYYFEVADGPDGPGVAYQRVYGTDDRPADLLAEVRTGDVVTIPHGWHGPSMAAPGYDLYYLNVMAGPSPGRDWLISDDPEHAWIRDTWPSEPVDPRLPMTGGES